MSNTPETKIVPPSAGDVELERLSRAATQCRLLGGMSARLEMPRNGVEIVRCDGGRGQFSVPYREAQANAAFVHALWNAYRAGNLVWRPEALASQAAKPAPAESAPAAPRIAAMGERSWQPWERNYSGNRIGVRQQDDWTILSVLAGGAETTSSIRDHEAWNLALQVSPAIGDRLRAISAENSRMRDALHTLSPVCAAGNADELREAAEEIDCGDSCQHHFYDGSCNSHECSAEGTDEGCRRQRADGLRGLADALETNAALANLDPTPGQADGRAAADQWLANNPPSAIVSGTPMWPISKVVEAFLAGRPAPDPLPSTEHPDRPGAGTEDMQS